MGRSRNREGARPLPLDKGAVKKIITTDNPQELVKQAKKIGKNLADVGLTTSQIRNIFTTARKLQAAWPKDSTRARRQLVLLKPKLAYQAQRKREVGALQPWLEEAIDQVIAAPDPKEERTRFMRFMEFFEAILAYHAAAGGKQEEKRR